MQHMYSYTVRTALNMVVDACDVFENLFHNFWFVFSFRQGKKGSERSKFYKMGTGKVKYPHPAVINYVCIVLKSF